MGHDISNKSFQGLGDIFLPDNLDSLADGRMLDRFGYASLYLLNIAKMDDLLLKIVERKNRGIKYCLLYDILSK